MSRNQDQPTLFPNERPATRDSGPVTCLGMTFDNDEARRAHFTEELRKKLQDPEFRKIEGFPIGSDEDILNLSDPPYYTACPNPWIADFIADWEAEKVAVRSSEFGVQSGVGELETRDSKLETNNAEGPDHLPPPHPQAGGVL